MHMAENLQSLGYLLKKEKLASFASIHAHKVLLLESLEPFPGFYEEYFVPTTAREQKPKSVFMVIKDFDICHEDDFIRITMHIKQDHKIAFDAALSSIVLFNEHATAIRVNMDDYSLLSELISHFKLVGVKFQPEKQVKPYQSLIKIRRFFDLEVLAEGIYKDADKADTYYLQVPSFMTWSEFEKATIAIRNNFDYKTYDAAQAAIYDKQGIIELVRIYDRKADILKLQSLRQKYIIEVERK
jgi:hypothetical protein